MEQLDKNLNVKTEPKSTGRFDYVKYDDQATDVQIHFKGIVELLEQQIEKKIKSPRAKATALTNLEVVYMWIGKGIRDDQVARNSETKLQEGRTNS